MIINFCYLNSFNGSIVYNHILFFIHNELITEKRSMEDGRLGNNILD